MTDLTLTKPPSVKVGLLMRTTPEHAFDAFRDPKATTKFWYTKSSGMMSPGAKLQWEWEMYGVSTDVAVDEVDENRRIAFRWSSYDPTAPTKVEFRFNARGPDATYVEIVETGFRGDGDTVVEHVIESTAGFTFVLCSLKAYLEHDLALHIIEDAHPDARVA